MNRRRTRPNWFRIILLCLLVLGGAYVNRYIVAEVEPLGVPSPTPTISPESLIAKADGEFKEGKLIPAIESYKQAIAAFERAATDARQQVRAMSQVALCLSAVGRHEDAAKELVALLKSEQGTDIERLNMRYFLARTLETLHRTQKACELYVVIHKQNPEFRDVEIRLRRLNPAWSLASFSSPRWIKGFAKYYGQRLRACF